MTYQYPIKGKYKLGTRYGAKGRMWACGWHSGLDLFSHLVGGDGKIYPIAEGVVISNKKSAAYGNYVSIKHDDGYISLYAHMAGPSPLKVGERVSLDTVLGIEGTTGNSTAVHVHIEIHKEAYHYPSNIDPEKFLLERMMTAPTAIETLAKKGIINDPVYWIARYRDLKYLDKLLIGIAVHARKKVAEVTALPAALDRLTAAEVISSPDYWKDNSGKIPYLDKLIISASQYV